MLDLRRNLVQICKTLNGFYQNLGRTILNLTRINRLIGSN